VKMIAAGHVRTRPRSIHVSASNVQPDGLAALAPLAKVVEIAALLGDSVVAVKHCMDPKGGKANQCSGPAINGLAPGLSVGLY
jgi:hypothetical protein